MSCISVKQILWPFVRHHEEDDDRAGINYRHVLSLGESTGIGVRTLLQQVQGIYYKLQ